MSLLIKLSTIESTSFVIPSDEDLVRTGEIIIS